MEEQNKQPERIVIYDDDINAIVDRDMRYVGEARIQVVYFKHSSESDRGIMDSLQKVGVSKDLVTIISNDELFNLAIDNITNVQIPFPQDADRYIIDGLGYSEGSKGGFPCIASRLPKGKVLILSTDPRTRMKAREMGYNAERD